MDLLVTNALPDVGGGSVKNGRRHSLARIPLRWMIRECFNLGTGIIFDAHMLKHEIGLDINAKYEARPANDIKDREEPVIDTKDEEGLTIEPISKPPQAPLEVTCHLDAPDPPEKGFSLLQIPRVVISAIYSPFNPNPFKSTSTPDPPPPRSKGEATEQLNDAICPIFDEYEKHWYWKAIDRMRRKSPHFPACISGNEPIPRPKLPQKDTALRWTVRTIPGPTNPCESPPPVTYHRRRAAPLITVDRKTE